MTVTPEHIRWCVEHYPLMKDGYPVKTGAVKGNRTSEAAAAFLDADGGRLRWSNCEAIYGFMWNCPNHEATRRECDDFLTQYRDYRPYGGYHPRVRDLVLNALAFEIGELRGKQEIVRAVGPPVRPAWGCDGDYRAIVDMFHEWNKDEIKAMMEIIDILRGHYD